MVKMVHVSMIESVHHSGGSRGRKGRPLWSKFLYFLAVFDENWSSSMLTLHPPPFPGVGVLSGKSWIRHCITDLILAHLLDFGLFVKLDTLKSTSYLLRSDNSTVCGRLVYETEKKGSKDLDQG